MKKFLFLVVLAMALFFSAACSVWAATKILTFAWEQGVADTSDPDFGGWQLLQGAVSGGPYLQVGNDIIFEVAKTEYQADFEIVVPDGVMTTRYYVMIAFNKTAQGSLIKSGYSNEVTALLDFESPPEPIIMETLVPGPTTLRLVWTQVVSEDFAGWDLLLSSEPGGPYAVAHSIPFVEEQAEYTADFEVEVAGNYFVLVSRDVEGNVSGYSNEVVGKVPGAPFNLTVTVTAQ